MRFPVAAYCSRQQGCAAHILCGNAIQKDVLSERVTQKSKSVTPEAMLHNAQMHVLRTWHRTLLCNQNLNPKTAIHCSVHVIFSCQNHLCR